MDRFNRLMELVTNSFTLVTNMNDVFGWACAESGEIDASDIEEIFPIYEKYGHWTLIAYEVLRREKKEYPAHGDDKNPKFLAALSELEILASNGTILYEQYYERMKKENKVKS